VNRLVKYLSVILKWRRFIFWNTLIMTLLAVGISFILPQRFTATAQVMPPNDESDIFGVTSILGGGMGGSRLRRLGVGMFGSTPSDLIVGIVGSRTITQKVAEACSIAHYYHIRRPSPEKTVKQLREMTTIMATEDGLVRISVAARTPHLASSAANAFVAQLDTFLRASNMSRGRNMRVFIEHRLTEVDSSLLVARESLRVFQSRNRVITIDDETKAAVETYAKLKSQLTIKEVELEASVATANDDNPYVSALKGEISAFRGELAKLEGGAASNGFGVGFGVSFERLPGVAAEFARRYQDFVIQQEAYAGLYQQLEYARILEARDAPAITILDYAVPPERRSSPRRALVVTVVCLFALVLGVLAAFAFEYLRRLADTDPETYRALRSLWRSSHFRSQRTDASVSDTSGSDT